MIDQKQCYFCTSSRKAIDYKDGELLRRFLNSNMKIMARTRTGLCASHQRQIARAIKQSRELGSLAYKLY